MNTESMNREEILSAAQKNKGEMDERVAQQYLLGYVIGAGASVILCSIFVIAEVIRDRAPFGYLAVIMMQLGISGLVFGIRVRDTVIGKLFIGSGCICSFACILQTVLYFMIG